MTVILLLKTRRAYKNPIPGTLNSCRENVFQSLGIESKSCSNYNKEVKKRVDWSSVGPILAAILALGFYGGLFFWLEIQESGGVNAIFQDKDKMLAKILLGSAVHRRTKGNTRLSRRSPRCGRRLLRPGSGGRGCHRATPA